MTSDDLYREKSPQVKEAIARLPHMPTDAELSDMTLTGGGWTIRWSALDMYLPVDDVQECIYGSQQWMSQLLTAKGQR